MTINSEQIQALKAAADDATQGSWVNESGEGWEAICCDDDQGNAGFIIAEFQGRDAAANRKFVQAANPAAIRSLLAERDADKALIEELQNVRAAAEKLVRCKGRYHSEQNYRALAALFGVSAPDLPPLDSEARTLTVKLPESVIDAICLTAAEIHNLGRGVSDDRAQEIINSIRCAAGITLVVGE